jgi:hypothetical protein
MGATIFQLALYYVPMDPYEGGLAFGRLAALACCLLVVLAVIGGIVWAILHLTRKRP